jgi:hypothetical protein
MRILPAHVICDPSSEERVALEKVGSKFAQISGEGPVYFLTDKQLTLFLTQTDDICLLKTLGINIMDESGHWVLSGRGTYDNRFAIKELGGVWNAEHKAWYISQKQRTKRDIIDVLSTQM